MNQGLQGFLDFQEWMEQKARKESQGTLPVILDHLVQRVSQVALDVQDMLEHLENKVCVEFKGAKDHLEIQDHRAPWGHQGVQVTQGCLD